MRVTYNTIKNTKQLDKPNEDLVFCDMDKSLFVLLDGVSRDNEEGQYPNPSPAVDVDELVIEEINSNINLVDLQDSNILDVIIKALQKANDKIRIYNESKKLLFAAGTVGIVAIIQHNILYYAYIGDCYGRLVYEDKVITFTNCQTELISEHKKEFTSYEIREMICNNNMHPYAYGVLNGDKRAIDFICLGEIDISDVKQIILTSDGLEDFLLRCPSQILIDKDADLLIKDAILYDNKKQDDRTIIKIELKGC